MYRRILVPIDAGEPARCALREAAALAEAGASELFLVHVLDRVEGHRGAGSARARRLEEARTILDDAKASCCSRPASVQTRVAEARPGEHVADVVARAAAALDCALIVVGTHGRHGFSRALLGSTAESVLRLSPVPVLVVRAAAALQPAAGELRVPYLRILVPIDGSLAAERALDEAMRLGLEAHGRLRLMHVVGESSADLFPHPLPTLASERASVLREGGIRLLERAAGRVAAAGLDVETVLVDDDDRLVADAFRADAAGWLPDVVVLGSRGRRGVQRRLLGGDAEQIARCSPVPVLVVPALERAAGARDHAAPVAEARMRPPPAA